MLKKVKQCAHSGTDRDGIGQILPKQLFIWGGCVKLTETTEGGARMHDGRGRRCGIILLGGTMYALMASFG